MKVTAPQLATWIIRDGWRAIGYGADGSRTYAGPQAWTGTVTVPADRVDELDKALDRAFSYYHDRPHLIKHKETTK